MHTTKIEESRESGSMLPTMLASSVVSVSTKVVVAILLMITCCGGWANPEAPGTRLAEPCLPVEPAAEEGDPRLTPAGWTTLTMVLDGGAKRKTVMVRDDSEAAEVTLYPRHDVNRRFDTRAVV